MKFEVSIYNAGCNDGGKVIDSIKAAYLYADTVRVYDILYPDYFEERLIESEQKRQIKEGIKYDTVGIFVNANSYVSCDSFTYVADRMHYLRHKKNEFYSKQQYRTDLKRLGVKLIAPEVDEFNLKRINDIFCTYVTKCWNESGYKLFNSNPMGIDLEFLEPAVILSPHLSEYVISSLPGFENATVDEIIDIRKELDKFIIPYRAAILRMTQDIKGVPYTDSFQIECMNLYLREIEPRVAAINAAIDDNNVYKNIAKKVITNKETWASIGALVTAFATQGDIANAVSIGAATVFGGLSITEGIVSTLEEKKKIKDNEMFFLYEVGQRLKK